MATLSPSDDRAPDGPARQLRPRHIRVGRPEPMACPGSRRLVAVVPARPSGACGSRRRPSTPASPASRSTPLGSIHRARSPWTPPVNRPAVRAASRSRRGRQSPAAGRCPARTRSLGRPGLRHLRDDLRHGPKRELLPRGYARAGRVGADADGSARAASRVCRRPRAPASWTATTRTAGRAGRSRRSRPIDPGQMSDLGELPQRPTYEL